MKRWCMDIIGCGWAGEQHARAMHALSDRVDLAAVADVDPDRARVSAAAWHAPRWTTDYTALLDSAALDAVSVCLPHHLHAPAAIAAANAGLHVLIEKPLATSLAEADAMIAAAAKGGVHLMVAENIRFDATYERAAALIQQGKLGNLFLVRLAREHEMHNYLRQRPWFLREPSGGILYSGGIHDFELLRMLAGEIDRVYALQAPHTLPEMVADDTAVVLVGLRSGAVAVVAESFSLKTPYPGVHGTVHGSHGSLWFSDNRLHLYAQPEHGAEEVGKMIELPATNTFQSELAHFLTCLDRQEEPRTSARSQRQPLVAVLAAYESIKRSERVYLSEIESSDNQTTA